MSYTKGNWEVIEGEVKIKNTSKSICAVNRNIQEHNYNAQLISAAPDLLEALQICMDWAEEYGMDYILYEKAKAAISKAIGVL